MSPVRVGVLISVALVFAVTLALIARSLASGHERPAPVAVAPPKPMVRVLVAARDLAPGDRLALTDFSWQPWPREALNPNFIADGPIAAPAAAQASTSVKIETAAVNAAVNKTHEMLLANDGGPAAHLVDGIVREAILQGEPILAAKVVHAGQSGVMAVELSPGMRAVSLPVTAESAAGGFVLPGDHVDVMESRQIDASSSGGRRFVSGTVLKNVKVLAIDQNTGHGAKSAAVIGATATLEVTPAQAELVVLSKVQGTLSLTLRSYADIAGSAISGSVGDDDEKGGDVVKVFRNGKPDEVAVAR
jgi:pilus assembly protein CpaB